tara:strand:+ start:893 stop:1117 length:225 start_codon:yes stop_codon:yes gene_type:complete
MISGREQEDVMYGEVYGSVGMPETAEIQILSSGIMVCSKNYYEIGIPWETLHKILQHPEVESRLADTDIRGGKA